MGQNFINNPEVPYATNVPDAAPAENMADLHGVHILVVDDELDARRIASLALHAAGALVYSAHDKNEALQLIGKNSFDVLVCDLAMPNGDGFSLLEQMRNEGRLMPAIALSALQGETVQARVQQAGFALHLEKPFEISALVAAVAQVVGINRNA